MFENLFRRERADRTVTLSELREVLIPVITVLSERISDLERRVDVLEREYLNKNTIRRM